MNKENTIQFENKYLQNELDQFLNQGGVENIKCKIQGIRSDIEKIEDFFQVNLREEVTVLEDLSCVYWNNTIKRIIFVEVDIESKILNNKPILECSDWILLTNEQQIKQLFSNVLDILKSNVKSNLVKV